MEKVQFSEGDLFEWWDNNGISHWTRRRVPRRRNGEARETPQEMVRSLQGVFCKGRYRSWKAPVGDYGL